MLALKPIVIDTSVLFDIFFVDSERHVKAKELALRIKENNITLRTPFHAFFELHAVIKQKRLSGSGQLSSEFSKDNALQLVPEPIDESFLSSALNPDLPYIKGADFIFLCLAARDEIPLLSEDKKLRMKAEEAGIMTYSIDELNEFLSLI